jgi:hypothetical protein
MRHALVLIFLAGAVLFALFAAFAASRPLNRWTGWLPLSLAFLFAAFFVRAL